MRNSILVGVLGLGTVAPAVAHGGNHGQKHALSVDVFGRVVEDYEEDPPGVQEALTKLRKSFSKFLGEVMKDATDCVTTMLSKDCSEGVRVGVRVAFDSAAVCGSILSSFAVVYWPKVQPPIEDSGRLMAAIVSELGKAIGKLSTKSYDATLKKKVDTLKIKMQDKLELITASLDGKVKEARETTLARSLTAFANLVAQLAGLLAKAGIASYESGPVQSGLEVLQTKTGELLAWASKALRVDVTELTTWALDKVKGYAKEAVAAVNLCNPDVRTKAMKAVKIVTGKFVEGVTYLIHVIEIERKAKAAAAALKDQWQSEEFTQIRNNLKKSIVAVTENIKGNMRSLQRNKTLFETGMDFDPESNDFEAVFDALS